MSNDILARLRRMSEAVLARYGGLRQLLELGDEITVGEYARGLIDGRGSLSSALRTALIERASASHSDDAVSALRGANELPLVNTADHCGLLFQFPFLQANLLYAYGAYTRQQSAIVVLSTGNIPFNNATNPRAVYWDGTRRHILPDRFRANLVIGSRGFTRAHYEASLPPEIREIVPFEAVAQRFFSEQVSAFNTRLWEYITASNPAYPRLVYLQLEDLALDLLEHSLGQRDEFYLLCCSEAERAVAIRALDGLPYCWTGCGSGSQLFWGRTENGRAERLICRNGALEGESIRVVLQPEPLLEALKSHRLVPSNFLSLALLLKHGAELLGGANQVERLPLIQKPWAGLLRSFGFGSEAEKVETADTHKIVTGPIIFHDDGYRHCGVEELVRDAGGSLRRMDWVAQQCSVKANVLTLMMPVLYRSLGREQQDPDILSLTSADIASCLAH